MSKGNTHILPDSRLEHNPDLGCLVIDWKLSDGTVARVEVQPIFCANCGKKYGWVPKDNTTFVCWLCNKCHEKFGNVIGTYAMPDEEFCRNVQQEMQERFGHDLTLEEIAYLKDRGELGPELTLLEKESPYKVPSNAS